MDNEKSREFYLDRYYKAIKQFGANSLTAKICKEKLELLGARVKREANSEASLSDEDLSENEVDSKPKLETDDVS